ncbi:DUF302 domain-containing protein [Billgrantia diversa]|uniref:DUF302 domain-containing protein n=1 Tax=Halomonas sp. MCCC 1A13316 TaxID=2733487 RepID=UPI0018A698F7|nr:DUF302 domain-containing protein [Halomonas sp. MCCC 1A13316]QOR39792.1 DUF302 domain-containing protein [Halomonas sp. MCCC 1A13316]
MKLIHKMAMAGLALILAAPLAADVDWPQEGWEVRSTEIDYDELLSALKEAVEAEEMAVVTEAGPTEAAANRGVTIPGNRVVGVFRNDYAVKILKLSVPAMIEAPIRFYVTENENDSATLSWKTPSHVFAPYAEQAGPELESVAEELDAIFNAIADRVEAAAAQ